MSFGFSSEDVRAVMLRHLEGNASPEETWQLELLLRHSPEAQREFAELLVQVVQLHSIGHEQNVIGFDQGEATGRLTRSLTRWALAAAAVGVIGLAGWFFLERGPHRAPARPAFSGIPDATAGTNGVALLTHAAGVVWADDLDANLDLGVSLSPGRLRLEQGAIQLEFSNKAHVILEGPAELELVSGTETALRFGRLGTHVPSEARGFVVRAAGTRIVDLGTEFGVSKPPGKALEVHVFEGLAQLSGPDPQGAARELKAGEAVRIEQRQSQDIAPDRTAFITEEELDRRESAERQERYSAWKKASQRLADDPATLVHFDFVDQPAANRRLPNQATSGSSLKFGEIIGGHWVEGRWSNKRALEFSRPGDRVHLVVPGRFTSLTCLAWVWVNSLPNYFNGLSLSERRTRGAVHWQLLRQGGVEFSVMVSSSTSENVQSGWDRVLSGPIVTPERLGRWVHLAAVYDGSKRIMAVYVDGQKVQWKTIEQPVELVVGDLGLGNWSPLDLSPRLQKLAQANPSYLTYLTRSFRGRMDEFTLLSRSLSSEEIQRQYEIGRPGGLTRSIRLPSHEGSEPLPMDAPAPPMRGQGARGTLHPAGKSFENPSAQLITELDGFPLQLPMDRKLSGGLRLQATVIKAAGRNRGRPAAVFSDGEGCVACDEPAAAKRFEKTLYT